MPDLRASLLYSSNLLRLYHRKGYVCCSSPLRCLFMLWCSKAIPTKLGQPCTGKRRMSAVTLTDRSP